MICEGRTQTAQFGSGRRRGFLVSSIAGGGIYNFGTITSCSNTDPTSIFFNQATTNGGGIYNVGDVYFLGGESIADNTANYGAGGGVYNGTAALLDLSNVQFLDNDALEGGGLYNDGNATLDSGTVFDGNQANLGGGLYLTQTSATTFNNVTVSGNQLVGAAPQAVGIGFVAGATLNKTNLTDKDDPNGQPVQFQ